MIHAIVSFLIAVLSGLGVGSGGLLVIYLTLVLGVEQLTAQGVNLWFFLFSSAASLGVNMGRRRLFWDVILIMSLAGIVGSAVGSFAANALPEHLLRRIFGGMLTLSGILVLIKKRPRAEDKQKGELK